MGVLGEFIKIKNHLIKSLYWYPLYRSKRLGEQKKSSIWLQII
jgi:hypothetical protein